MQQPKRPPVMATIIKLDSLRTPRSQRVKAKIRVAAFIIPAVLVVAGVLVFALISNR